MNILTGYCLTFYQFLWRSADSFDYHFTSDLALSGETNAMSNLSKQLILLFGPPCWQPCDISQGRSGWHHIQLLAFIKVVHQIIRFFSSTGGLAFSVIFFTVSWSNVLEGLPILLSYGSYFPSWTKSQFIEHLSFGSSQWWFTCIDKSPHIR